MLLTFLQLVVFDPDNALDIPMRGYLSRNHKVLLIGWKLVPKQLKCLQTWPLAELNLEASFSEGREEDFLVFPGSQL